MRIPAVGARSFTPIGTPRNGASVGVESASRAVSSAWSATTVTKELRVGSSSSIRSSDARTSSTAESWPLRTSRACSTAERNASSIGGEATSRVDAPSIGTLGGMSRSALARDLAAERFELLDRKREVFDLYRSIRADPDPVRAWDDGGGDATS